MAVDAPMLSRYARVLRGRLRVAVRRQSMTVRTLTFPHA